MPDRKSTRARKTASTALALGALICLVVAFVRDGVSGADEVSSVIAGFFLVLTTLGLLRRRGAARPSPSRDGTSRGHPAEGPVPLLVHLCHDSALPRHHGPYPYHLAAHPRQEVVHPRHGGVHPRDSGRAPAMGSPATGFQPSSDAWFSLVIRISDQTEIRPAPAPPLTMDLTLEALSSE